jgi:hypothetical protein
MAATLRERWNERAWAKVAKVLVDNPPDDGPGVDYA